MTAAQASWNWRAKRSSAASSAAIERAVGPAGGDDARGPSPCTMTSGTSSARGRVDRRVAVADEIERLAVDHEADVEARAAGLRTVERRQQPEHGHRAAPVGLVGRSRAGSAPKRASACSTGPTADPRPSPCTRCGPPAAGAALCSTSPSAWRSRSRSARRFGARPGSAVAQVGEAAVTDQQLAEDQQGPAIADGVEGHGDRAVLVVGAWPMSQRYDRSVLDFNCIVEILYQRAPALPAPDAVRSRSDAARRRARHLHGLPGHPDPVRRLRRHPGVVPRGQHDDDVVGAVRLHAGVRRPARAGRAAGRPMGTQVGVPRRPGRVHGRVGALRLGADAPAC